MDQVNLNGDNLSDEEQQQLLFMMLIRQHQQIAMMGMGKTENPQSGETDRDLKSAKFSIDTLVMLQEYTEGNLSEKLENYLTETLDNLRMNYADEKEDEPENGEEA